MDRSLGFKCHYDPKKHMWFRTKAKSTKEDEDVSRCSVLVHKVPRTNPCERHFPDVTNEFITQPALGLAKSKLISNYRYN
jgi:hypothetical protein